MNLLQDYLVRAAKLADTEIHLDCAIEIQDGPVIRVEALLPSLGPPRGLFVVSEIGALGGYEDHLVELGYGYSTLSMPEPEDVFEPVGFADLFNDWGNNREHDPDADLWQSHPYIEHGVRIYSGMYVRGPECHTLTDDESAVMHCHVGSVGPIRLKRDEI